MSCEHEQEWANFDTYCNQCVANTRKRLAEAVALLERIATELEGEMALAGPVPFDPEEIRAFLGASA